jgi:formylglycine-generating enzyme required for sulfatase activity
MRWFSLFLLALSVTVSAGEQYPLWDGHESVADYAKRVNLPTTKTLDLGNGVKMELVLIPAGKFIMGTPEPPPVDEEGFRKNIVTRQALLAAFGLALLVMLIVVTLRAIRKRRWPQWSLRWMALMTLAAGGCVLSGLHWRQSAKALEAARLHYKAAKARFDSADNSEKPAHFVILTKPFYMGKFVVTQEQYYQIQQHDQIQRNPPGAFTGKNDPVDCVSWSEAGDFCKKLCERTKWTARLPTEAEWEYACRAGTTTMFYSGDSEADLDCIAWNANNSKNTKHPVGQKKPNAFGLYDMIGNVWQLCQDWYGPYSIDSTTDPQGPPPSGSRILRGGAWSQDPSRCRSAYREAANPTYRVGYGGFRIVCPGVP